MLKINRRKNHAPYYFADGTEPHRPNYLQMSTALKGRDVLHDERQKRKSFWLEVRYGILVVVILIAAIAAMFIIAEAVR